MKTNKRQINGAATIVKAVREAFRVSENLDFYSETDLKTAERKFVRLCLQGIIPVSCQTL